MPKKFLTAQSATFKVLPADTGIAKALDDPMGVKGLNPFHDLMAGFVKVDAEGQPYTVGVLPDTVSILGSDTILIAEDPSDTFTFSIPTTATPQLAGLGIGTSGSAQTIDFGSGLGAAITAANADLRLSTTGSLGALTVDVIDGVAINALATTGQFAVNVGSTGHPGVLALTSFTDTAGLGALLQLSPDGSGLTAFIENAPITLATFLGTWVFASDGSLAVSGPITRDSGDLTLSTTTSGDLILEPFGRIHLQADGGSGAEINVNTDGGVSIASVGAGVIELATPTENSSKIQFVDSGVAADGFIYLLAGVQATTFNSSGVVSTGSVSASGYLVGANPGIDTTITTGSLVGKTITIEKGLITGFA